MVGVLATRHSGPRIQVKQSVTMTEEKNGLPITGWKRAVFVGIRRDTEYLATTAVI